MLQSTRVQSHVTRPNGIQSHLPHLRINMFVEEYALFRVLAVKIPLQLQVGELVSLLEPAIILTVLLDGVVSKVDQIVSEVVQIERCR